MKTSIVILSIFLLILNSCVSFNRRQIKNDLYSMTENQVKQIEGKYNTAGYSDIKRNRIPSQFDKPIGVSDILDLKTAMIKENNEIEVSLSPLKENKYYELKLRLLKDDSLVYSFNYNAKLKKGMLLLDNYSSVCNGIPFLFGGCRRFQARIGLTKDNNLLIQNYHASHKTVLFILGVANSGNTAEKYKRIQ